MTEFLLFGWKRCLGGCGRWIHTLFERSGYCPKCKKEIIMALDKVELIKRKQKPINRPLRLSSWPK